MQRSVAKPVDVLDKKAALEKSVGVLKAHDPEIQEVCSNLIVSVADLGSAANPSLFQVLATAAHVTLYDLDTTRMAYVRDLLYRSLLLRSVRWSCLKTRAFGSIDSLCRGRRTGKALRGHFFW